MMALDKAKANRAKIIVERDQIMNERQAALDKVQSEGRNNLTAEEEKEFRSTRAKIGRLDADIAALDERIGEFEAEEKRRLSLNHPASYWNTPNLGGGSAAWQTGYRSADEARSIAIDAVRAMPVANDAMREFLTRQLEQNPDPRDNSTEGLAEWAIATSDPAYLRSFVKVMADPMTGGARMTDDEARAFQRVAEVQRAMSLTGASGGYMVPLMLDPAVIVTNNGTQDPMRSIATKKLITTEKWRGISSAGVTASWDDEAEQVSDDAPTLVQPEVKPHRLTAFVPYSIEVGMDAEDFAEQIGELIVDAFDVAEGTAWWVGSGTTQPHGIVTSLDANTNAEVVVTTDGGFFIDDIYKVWEALPPRARRNASWAADITVLDRIRRFGEGATGTNAAFWQDLGGGVPPTLLGAPVYEASGMADFVAGSTGAQNIITVGDFSRYVIADRVGTTIECVPHLFSTNNNRPTGQRGFFAYKRTGGKSVADLSFRLLQNQ